MTETAEPAGPFGAKGVGEPGLVPTAPAIANAIYRAFGFEIHQETGGAVTMVKPLAGPAVPRAR